MSATLTVLVVEDEEAFIDALEVGLGREGFDVKVARDGAEDLEMFDRVAPDLPPGELTADELRDVQFAVVPRGYSMAQVDALLERLAEERDLRGPVADDTFEVDLPRGLPPVAYGPRPTGEQPPPR